MVSIRALERIGGATRGNPRRTCDSMAAPLNQSQHGGCWLACEGVLDESNDDNQLEDFDFEVVEEDVSLSAALCEVSEIQFK